MNISSLSNTPLYLSNQVSGGISSNSVASSSGEKSFGQMFSDAIEQVNSSQQSADQLTQSYLAGGPVEIHQMLIAMEKADLAIRQTVEIRDKVIDAYKQITNMQI